MAESEEIQEIFLDSNITIKFGDKKVKVDVYEASERLDDIFTRFPQKENRIEWYNAVQDYMKELGFEGGLSNGAALNFFNIIRKSEGKLAKKLSAAFPTEQG